MADDLLAQMDVVYNQSTLPHSPDLNQINDLDRASGNAGLVAGVS